MSFLPGVFFFLMCITSMTYSGYDMDGVRQMVRAMEAGRFSELLPVLALPYG